MKIITVTVENYHSRRRWALFEAVDAPYAGCEGIHLSSEGTPPGDTTTKLLIVPSEVLPPAEEPRPAWAPRPCNFDRFMWERKRQEQLVAWAKEAGYI